MAEVYSVSINKGGVGKTTLLTNIAGVLSRSGKKTCIIDTDGQGNAAIAFGLNPFHYKDTIYDVLTGKRTAEEVTIPIADNLDIIPANDDMNFFEFDIFTNREKYPNPYQLLSKHIDQLRDKYDYIFIDTPPSMSLVAGNVLACVDRVLIPFIPEKFAVRGLIRIVEAIRQFKEKENPKLEIGGVVGMMVDTRTLLHKELVAQAKQFTTEQGIKMFETIVPRSIRFANATFYDNVPAVWSDESNPLVSVYIDMTHELMSAEFYNSTKGKFATNGKG